MNSDRARRWFNAHSRAGVLVLVCCHVLTGAYDPRAAFRHVTTQAILEAAKPVLLAAMLYPPIVTPEPEEGPTLPKKRAAAVGNQEVRQDRTVMPSQLIKKADKGTVTRSLSQKKVCPHLLAAGKDECGKAKSAKVPSMDMGGIKLAPPRTLKGELGAVVLLSSLDVLLDRSAVQVCALPCSSHRSRVVDMLRPPACTGLSRTHL